jgi:uncharacterized protein (TIGR00369 family)
MELVDDQMCFVCGKRNSRGLQLDFELVGEDEIRTTFLPTQRFQGFKDLVHGGIIAMLLDEVMVNGVWLRGIPAVTGKLEVRLKHPAKVGEPLHFTARLVRDGGRTLEMEGQATTEQGLVVAEAKGLLMRIHR